MVLYYPGGKQRRRWSDCADPCRLICAFVVCIWQKRVFWWRGSYNLTMRQALSEYNMRQVIGILYKARSDQTRLSRKLYLATHFLGLTHLTTVCSSHYTSVNKWNSGMFCELVLWLASSNHCTFIQLLFKALGVKWSILTGSCLNRKQQKNRSQNSVFQTVTLLRFFYTSNILCIPTWTILYTSTQVTTVSFQLLHSKWATPQENLSWGFATW